MMEFFLNNKICTLHRLKTQWSKWFRRKKCDTPRNSQFLGVSPIGVPMGYQRCRRLSRGYTIYKYQKKPKKLFLKIKQKLKLVVMFNK